MEKLDYKKEYKDLYLPKTKPSIIKVPEMLFIMVHGKGNPNTSQAYTNALEVLYGLSYTIKMSKLGNEKPEGYFEYVVPPLEGLWWVNDGVFWDKDKLNWISMIRQPEFVTEKVFEQAKKTFARKKPDRDLSQVYLTKFDEGLCAQIMHIGPYDNEPATIKVLEEFITESGYTIDISGKRKHHEIYLGDPRKTASEKLKTVIRYPIKR